MTLPPPSALLGLPKFPSWYPGQESVFSASLSWLNTGPERFLGLSCPTGSGKSLTAALLAHVSGARTVILTATKALQEQYLDSFRGLGLVSVKGQNNFQCHLHTFLRADEGPCHEGLPCPVKSQCAYRLQLQAALDSDFVITNYAYWMAQVNYASGLGDSALLVCDESHLAFQSMENSLTIFLSKLDAESLGVFFPSITDQWAVWQLWAGDSSPVVGSLVIEYESSIKDLRSRNQPVPGHLSRSYRAAKSVFSRLQNMSTAHGDWVIQTARHGFQFTPKWVAGYSASLFHDVPKVLLMSAILSPRTLDIVGVPKEPEHRKWIEVGSHFPPQNTPIWHIPTVRVNYRTDDYGAILWLSRLDQIIQRRLDRKGIIFTVSYGRRDFVLDRSRFASLMVTHSTQNVVEGVERFKKMDPPAILVSPSVTTGFDFPGNGQPQYIVIGKVPYVDTKDPVTQARHGDDKEWTSYLAMETLVQGCGRMSRSASDMTECFLIDDSILWFMRLYSKFAPAWFRARYRGSLMSVPDAIFPVRSVAEVM